MKRIYITESQKNLLIKEAQSDTFSYETLASLKSFNARIKYCKQELGFPIGKGTSRMCFQLSDEWILKLAINPKGIVQNEHEATRDYYKDQMGIFAKVDYDLSDEENHLWVVSEYVLPAKERDFKECYGLSFGTFVAFVGKCIDNFSYRRRQFFARMSDEEFERILEEHQDDLFGQIYDYIGNYGIHHGDFMVLRNLGLVMRDGEPQIVILDDGVDDDILKQYYNRRL